MHRFAAPISEAFRGAAVAESRGTPLWEQQSTQRARAAARVVKDVSRKRRAF
jgi:hypothetical protein